MKTLLLLRHARADRGDPAMPDFDRPLAPRGRAAAPRIARRLRERGPLPDHVICSAARRARETWELVAAGLPAAPAVEIMRDLYMAAPAEMLRLARAAPPQAARVMIVGHNPGIAALAVSLAGAGSDPGARAAIRARFPTAALAVIDFDAGSWPELPASGALRAFVVPEDPA